MNDFLNLIDWSRAQFALTAIYHYLFVPLTLGLGIIIALMESKYVITGDIFYKNTVKFWMRLFAVNFAIGVATGIILEFEFGTNWSNYSYIVGDIFGAPLAIEGILAFFMESTFFAVMYFGWEKVGKKAHLAATWLTAIGANLSAFWILVANAWMEYPTGYYFNPLTARCEMTNFWDVISFVAINKFSHTVTSAFLLSAVFVVGVCAWYMLKKRNEKFTRYSIKVAAWFGIAGAVAVFSTGHFSAQIIARIQPMKLAAMENLYHGKKGAALSVVPGVEIPNMLSILAYGDSKAYVPGITNIIKGYKMNIDGKTYNYIGFDGRNNIGHQSLGDFQECQANYYKGKPRYVIDKVVSMRVPEYTRNMGHFIGYAFLNKPEEIIPPVIPVYWSFRIMVGFGMWMLLVLFVWLYKSYRPTSSTSKIWLRLSSWSILCAYIASECGWIVAEVGRQPWVIQDLLPVKAAISKLPTVSVVVTFWLFAVLFTVLLIAELSIMVKQIKNGPESVK